MLEAVVPPKRHVIVLTATLNDWGSVPLLLIELERQFVNLDVEATVVVVDDGSWKFDGMAEIAALPLTAIRSVIRVALYRNLGNQNAVAVGMGYLTMSLKGDDVIVMDSDLEDNPDYIPQLFQACQRENETKIIFAARSERSEGAVFRVLYKIYQHIYLLLTGASIEIGNYCIIPWKLARRVARISELWGHFPAAIMKARIPFASIPAARGRRRLGQSNMNMVNLLVHAVSALAVHAETVAIRILMASGVLGALASLLIAVLVGLKTFTSLPVVGWTSQIIGIVLMFVFQVFFAVCMMAFVVITLRTRPPNMPAIEFGKYILEVTTLRGVAPAPVAGEFSINLAGERMINGE